uniref:ATP synthase subunit 8 n=1 Tax=Segonzacia mesatlantica TaxID=352471 RepID=A0A343DQM4_9EUCA|nr:ATP synthase subunit 8 [Segonzacia mesatlantica]ARW69927.1 ATP synthase subunit 8 [Segonzacia mesatlantica]
MPQMAPLLWLYLYIFFLLSLMLFLLLNYFIKPFEKMSLPSPSAPTIQTPWSL